jgi:GDPmannose 4,6-dehydratase
MFACSGILFNHESPKRGETFVTRKITRALARIALGLQDCLYLGNLDARRDWGHAQDYVRAMWLMLQQSAPEDYVIASGHQHSVREFVDAVALELGIHLSWEGRGADEVGRVHAVDAGPAAKLQAGQTLVRVDRRYFRPAEVDTLLGDATKARRQLGWVPEVSFAQLVAEMAREDLRSAQRDEIVVRHGHAIPNRNEH